MTLGVFTAPAFAAGCFGAIASTMPRLMPASLTIAAADPAVDVAFIGHASFLIQSPQGVRIVTEYNDYFPPPAPPDIATMNHAHLTHYSLHPDPSIKYVLRGWDTGSGPPQWDVQYKDVRVRNVNTNIRDWAGGTEMAGNSIFIFEIADLCIAHLGHLHHTLTPEHLTQMGMVDVLMVPVDGVFTLSQEDMIQVIDSVKPMLIIPMHYYNGAALDRFLARMGGRFKVEQSTSSHITLTRAELPKKTEILIVPPDSRFPEPFR